jgi:hypothetical protein
LTSCKAHEHEYESTSQETTSDNTQIYEGPPRLFGLSSQPRTSGGHGPQYNLTRRIGGKTVNVHLKPGPELEKAEPEVAEHERFMGLVWRPGSRRLSASSRLIMSDYGKPCYDLVMDIYPTSPDHPYPQLAARLRERIRFRGHHGLFQDELQPGAGHLTR